MASFSNISKTGAPIAIANSSQSTLVEFLKSDFERYIHAINDSSITVDVLNKVVSIASTYFNQEGGYVVKLDEIQREFIVLYNKFGKIQEILQKTGLLGETFSSQIYSYHSITTCDERVIKQTDLLQENFLTNEFQILVALHTNDQEIIGIEDLPYEIIKIHDNVNNSSTSIGLIKRKYDGNGYLLLDEDPGTKDFTLDIMHQIFCGLQLLHANHISHADIKEENLLVRIQNNMFTVHIADFEGACFVKKAEDIFLIEKQPYSQGYTSEQDITEISNLKDSVQEENFLDDLHDFVYARDLYSCCYMICNLFIKDFSELQFQLGYRESSEFLNGLKDRGLSEQLISLFQRGLDSDYLNRPSATDFLEAPDFQI